MDYAITNFTIITVWRYPETPHHESRQRGVRCTCTRTPYNETESPVFSQQVTDKLFDLLNCDFPRINFNINSRPHGRLSVVTLQALQTRNRPEWPQK